MEATSVRAGWRFSTEASGGPCVTTIGTSMTPPWCAGSWAVAGPHRLREVPGLVRALGPLPWTTCAAQGRSPSCGAARTEAGTHTTATTGRTPASSAPVSFTPSGSLLCGVVFGLTFFFSSIFQQGLLEGVRCFIESSLALMLGHYLSLSGARY